METSLFALAAAVSEPGIPLLGKIAIALALVAIGFYLALPALMAYFDDRVSPPFVYPADSSAVPTDFLGQFATIRSQFEPLGYESAGVMRQLRSENKSGRTWALHCIFRHRTEPIIAMIAFSFGESPDGNLSVWFKEAPLLLARFSDGTSVRAGVGMGPDVSPDLRQSELWWRGADLRTATERFAEWVRATGRPTESWSLEEAPAVAMRHLERTVDAGLRSGRLVRVPKGSLNRMSIPFCIRLFWYSVPPGRFLWRNPAPR